MTQTIVSVVVFLALLAIVPLAIRWFQKRSLSATSSSSSVSKIVSALAVGPQQRVVTVEVGPQGSRTQLVLGVTTHSVTCLHSFALDESPDPMPSNLTNPSI
jgi:flagellar protein FliO/FliZ